MAWMRRAGSYMTRGRAVNLGWFGGFYDLKYYRNCDHLAGMSADMRDHIVRSGWPAERAHILRAYAPEATGRRLDRPEAPLLLALGRLHEAKAFDVLIDAMANVPAAHLWIAGEGHLRVSLEQQIARLGLGDRVKLLGWRNDRQDLLATCDICVFPSRYEPFGIVSIEAWAARAPLIAARSAGPGALIEDGADGLLVPIDDRAALTAAMNRLIGDRGLQARLVEGGRRRYEAEFTEAAVVASYKALFDARPRLGQQALHEALEIAAVEQMAGNAGGLRRADVGLLVADEEALPGIEIEIGEAGADHARFRLPAAAGEQVAALARGRVVRAVVGRLDAGTTLCSHSSIQRVNDPS